MAEFEADKIEPKIPSQVENKNLWNEMVDGQKHNSDGKEGKKEQPPKERETKEPKEGEPESGGKPEDPNKVKDPLPDPERAY